MIGHDDAGEHGNGVTRVGVGGVMLAVCLMVLAAGLGGCKSSESPIFFTSLSSPYPDVPVPASFTLTNQGTTGVAAGARSTDLSYQSTDAIEPITQYFSDQLPRHGWVLQTRSNGGNQVLMKYVKGGEVLQIEVRGSSTIRTNARIRITPAPRGSGCGDAGVGRYKGGGNAVDGSHFRMAVDVLWDMADGQKGCSVRLNLQLDVLEFVPADVSISGQGDGSEGRAFLAQGIRPEAVYLADRAFVDMAFISGVLDAGADLVVRLHGDTRFERLYSQPLDAQDQEAHVVSDFVGTMKRIGSRHLREVIVTDPRSGKSVRLLTSLLDVPAKVIGKLYRHRWTIELFFRWLKCVARVRHLISDSRNGVTLQFYAAIIAVLAGYIVTGTKPGLCEYNMLCGVLRGTTIESGMLEVLARRARERELERLRKARKNRLDDPRA